MEKSYDKTIKTIILRQGNDLIAVRASKILRTDFEANKRIGEVKELDIWSSVNVTIPKTDPHYSIDATNHLPALMSYIYKTSQPLSLKNKPELIPNRLDFKVLTNWLVKQKPKIVLCLDPISRDLALLIRRKEKIAMGIIALPIRFYTNAYWAGDEGDLWAVPLPENREQLLAEFVYDKRIIVTGPLVGKKQFVLLEKPISRKKLGWPQAGFFLGIVADGLLPGLVEELVERLSAYPDMNLTLVIISSDKDFRQNIEEKAQSFLCKMLIVTKPDEPDLLLLSLDLVIFYHDTLYLPEVVARQLPSIVISRKVYFNMREEELGLLSHKNAIWRASNLREVIWMAERILKNRYILKDFKNQIKRIIGTQPATTKIIEEIFIRMKK